MLRFISTAMLAAAGLAQAAGAAGAAGAAAPQTAVFAGGCFWSMEAKFEALPGVIDVVSGATGGRAPPASEADFAAGRTGNVEAITVTFDPARIGYRQLVDHYWRSIDPGDAGGQFCDRGANYATAVFATRAQRPIAEASRRDAAARLPQVRFVTAIRPTGAFWPAPAWHQDFARRNAERYGRYDRGCGRTAKLHAMWDGNRKTS